MNKLTNVLIIEQEPLISYSIEEALRNISVQNDLFCNMTSVYDYKSALNELNSSKHYNLVFLSIDSDNSFNKQSSLTNQVFSLLEKSLKNIQLMILIHECDNFLIHNLFKTLNPESILLKRDMKFKDLTTAIDRVIQNIPFYSTTILKHLRIRMSCNISLDKSDQLILYYLSKGVRMKDMSKMVFLSHSAIESRKRKLKQLFNAERQQDSFLFEKAREHGFI
ncbi:hypothetical protein [Psychroserpens sp.]|uniref:hypothetical protein n=1 Tax=Psychroserpens sp. TaxID=2020870 RepID=UPI002B270487|nr:hypothetical protein [Psychroserpens sp.]